jgi:protein FAM32A
VKELLFKEEVELASGSASGSNSPALPGSDDRKTDAERRFEEAQRRRVSFALETKALQMLTPKSSWKKK